MTAFLKSYANKQFKQSAFSGSHDTGICGPGKSNGSVDYAF